MLEVAGSLGRGERLAPGAEAGTVIPELEQIAVRGRARWVVLRHACSEKGTCETVADKARRRTRPSRAARAAPFAADLVHKLGRRGARRRRAARVRSGSTRSTPATRQPRGP